MGFVGAATLLMVSFYIKDPLLAMLSMGMASFCNDLTIPGSWTTCMDIGGKYAGTVSGSMNMMGNFGGMAGPLVVGYLLEISKPNPKMPPTLEGWHLTFAISAVIYSLGAICWLFIDPVTPLEKQEEV
jgi:MFS family permease